MTADPQILFPISGEPEEVAFSGSQFLAFQETITHLLFRAVNLSVVSIAETMYYVNTYILFCLIISKINHFIYVY